MNTAKGLRAADAAAAIQEMAARRGLHASGLEIETALKQVTAEAGPQWVAAAWAILFSRHSTSSVPYTLLHPGQLPAWVFTGHCVGLLKNIGRDGGEADITWLGTVPDEFKREELTVIVPLAPALLPPPVGADEAPEGIATAAIKTAVKAHMPLFVWAGVASIVMNLLAIGVSLFAMQVYDRVIPNFAEATLWVLASGVLLALVFEAFFKLLRLRLLETSALRLDEAISLYFFEKLLALKVDRRPSRVGSLVAQFRDYESIKSFFTSTTLFVLADLPFIVLFVAVIGLIGGPIAWVILIFLLVCLLIAFITYRPIARLQRAETDESARRLGLVFEAVSGGETVKATAAEPRFSDVWQQSTRAVGQVSSELRSVTAYSQFALAFFQQIAYIAVIIAGVYVIQAGDLTVGGLIACSILAGRCLSNVAQITQLLLQWHHAKYALSVLNGILARPSDDDETRQANTRTAPLRIEISNLRYAYDGIRHPQLEIPKLTIEPGARVAVIGGNGSGKSTLLKLLCGIATPNEGQVTVAGLDLQLSRPSWIRETVGYLPQDVRLFSGTLRENLTMGISVPDEATLLEAAEKTGLLRSLSRHTEGLELKIHEGGAGLSGGQRQMVGITRLVLQKPRVWLLDEPSASLDKDAEESLLRFLSSLPADETVIFTSHRPAWFALAQRVLLLENGAIKADVPAEQVRRAQIQGTTAAPEAVTSARPALKGAPA